MGNQFDRYEFSAKPVCRCGYVIDSLGCVDWHARHPYSKRVLRGAS